jgi:hypothetical protein
MNVQDGAMAIGRGAPENKRDFVVAFTGEFQNRAESQRPCPLSR